MAAPEPDEILIEFHDCARYDELDEVKKWLEDARIDVNGVDFNGSTALHKAAANGHLQVVQLLVSKGAKYLRNLSGHTPLSWAVQTKQQEVVKYLFEAFDSEIDVLAAPEKFTKSILHLAFDAGDPDIVQLVLAHSSAKSLEKEPAAEDAEDPAEEAETAAREDGDDDQAAGVGAGADLPAYLKPAEMGFAEHNLRFAVRPVKPAAASPSDTEQPPQEPPAAAAAAAEVSPEPTSVTLSIRELPAAAAASLDALSAGAAADQTGLALWAAEVVLARWLADRPQMLRGKLRLLELGSGCGLGGLLASVIAGPAATRVVLSDAAPHALKNIAYNVELNQAVLAEAGVASIGIQDIDWTAPETWPRAEAAADQEKAGADEEKVAEAAAADRFEQFDSILLADALYRRELVTDVVAVVGGLLRPDGGELLVVSPVPRQKVEAAALAEELRKVGVQLVSANPAPKKYLGNCSLGQDAETWHLYFGELAAAGGEFLLQRFVRTQRGPFPAPGAAAAAAKKRKSKLRRKADAARGVDSKAKAKASAASAGADADSP